MGIMYQYGVATISRIDKIVGLFCRKLALLSDSFAKETCNLIDPTNQSHPILGVLCVVGIGVGNIVERLRAYR